MENLEWVTNVKISDIKSGRYSIRNGSVGDPHSTEEGVSVDDLKNANMVGVYKKKGDTEFKMVDNDAIWLF